VANIFFGASAAGMAAFSGRLRPKCLYMQAMEEAAQTAQWPSLRHIAAS